MLRRVSRGLGHSSKQPQKFHLKVDVEKLDNLPGTVKKCRVVWSRGPKVQMTAIKDVAKGAVVFKQQLSQIATMYRDDKQGYEPKEYKFQVQVPAKGDEAKFITVGKADIDLAFFVLALGQPQSKLVPIMFKVGAASTGYLKLLITAEAVAADADNDGMTEVSGMTGAAHLTEEQDLSGFNEEAEEDSFSFKWQSKPSPTAASDTARSASRFAASPPPQAAATAAAAPAAPAVDEPKPWEVKGPVPGGRRDSSASSKALAAAAAAVAAAGCGGDDGDISPMSLSPRASAELPPEQPPGAARAGSRGAGSRGAGKPSVVGGKGGCVAAGGSNTAAAAAGAAAKDARSQLFGSAGGSAAAAGKGGAPGRSLGRRRSSKSIPELSEDEARSELFSSAAGTRGHSSAAAAAAGSAANQGSRAANGTSSNGGRLAGSGSAAQAAAAAAAAGPSKPPVDKPAAPIPRSSSASSNNAGVSAASAAAAGAGGRRSLLDRSWIKDAQEQPTAAAAAGAEAPGSSTAAAGSGAASSGTDDSRAIALNGHSLSDTDEDYGSSSADSYSNAVQLLKVPASRQGSSAVRSPLQLATASRQASSPVPAAAAAAGSASAGPDSTASRQLAIENEKLWAQIVALREHGAAAEDARRQARLAAENAAAERDEYREQAEELQQQLKEAIVGMLASEKEEELQQQVQQLQEQLQQQQQNEQPGQPPGGAQQWQQECGQLHQLLTDAVSRADHLQQQLEEQQQLAAEHVQQLQQQLEQQDTQHQEQQHSSLAQLAGVEQQLADAKADAENAELHSSGLAAQVAELTQALEATQELLQLQQGAATQADSAAKRPSSTTDVPALSNMIVDLKAKVEATEQKVVAAEKQRAAILEVLLREAHTASQQAGVMQHVGNRQLVEAAHQCTAFLDEDSALQEAVQQALVGFKAAMAALVEHTATEVHLTETITILNAALEEAEAVHKTGCVQQQQQPCMNSLMQQIAQLESQVSQLQQDRRLLQQQQQQPGMALEAQHVSTSEGNEKLAKTRQQLASTRRKVQQLTQVRDKLEIILRDFEAAAAEEKQQLVVQLTAANLAGRQATCQLTDMGKQLEQAQEQLAEACEKQRGLQQQLEAQQLGAQAAAAAAAAVGSGLQVIALADSAGPSGMQEALAAAHAQAAELQKQLAEAEAGRRAVDAELGRLRRQLAEEQSERGALEEQLVQQLQESEDFMAQDAVAAYEAKYNRLKTRYRELTEAHREEVDALHDEIASLQEHMVDLEAAAAQLEAARSQAQHGEATLAEALAKFSRANSELASMRSENQTLMQALVNTKLELAQCSEREVVGRRELHKAKETNMKLASKMTRLEVQMYKK